jgi:hypothetical protein
MRLLVVSDEITHLSVQEVKGLQNVWDLDHIGLKRISIRINTLPNSKGRLAVIADPSVKTKTLKPAELLPLINW